MRLINTTTLKLSEFHDFEIPRYATLSHTWGKDEVTYQEWLSQQVSYKAGYAKIVRFCQICRQDGFEWAWADTCCIDKTSSAELSEAINSMYRWYQGKMCYAYLVDVHSSDHISAQNSAFCSSNWFRRGWTLQELIAPLIVHFYSKDWIKIAQRADQSELITRITAIPQRLLMCPSILYQYSIAQKMSWASKRKTTRIEDIAYCLMGLFDVNIPLLYGEGEKAFLRLQEEIMKFSSDHTLFAWFGSPGAKIFMDCGLLAPSPEYFAGSSCFVKQIYDSSSIKPYSMTNRGLEIELSLSKPLPRNAFRMAILNCASEESPSKNVTILLAPALTKMTQLSQSAVCYEGDYMRKHCHKLELLDRYNIETTPERIYIRRGGPMLQE